MELSAVNFTKVMMEKDKFFNEIQKRKNATHVITIMCIDGCVLDFTTIMGIDGITLASFLC
jgi:hypothetical protein